MKPDDPKYHAPFTMLTDANAALDHLRDCYERQDRFVILTTGADMSRWNWLAGVFNALRVPTGNVVLAQFAVTFGTPMEAKAVLMWTIPQADFPRYIFDALYRWGSGLGEEADTTDLQHVWLVAGSEEEELFLQRILDASTAVLRVCHKLPPPEAN